MYCEWSNIQRKCKTATKYPVLDKIRGDKDNWREQRTAEGRGRSAGLHYVPTGRKDKVDLVKDGNEASARRKA
jgi:hypothetical protein